MWIFTVFGFFSVVTGEPGGHEVQVRARNRSHLGNLATLAGWNATRILETPHADYRFRIIVTPGEWEAVASKLATGAEQVTNFKSAAQAALGRTDPKYVEALHEVWGVMHRYQEDSCG